MDCPTCGSPNTVCLSRVEALYRCRACGDHFEDDDTPTVQKAPRTKMRREEE